MLAVRDAGDLKLLTRSYGRYDSVSIGSESIASAERRRWEEALRSSYTACGCDSGGAAVLIALVALPLIALLVPATRGAVGALLYLGLLLAAAVAGKALGIATARLRLAKQVRQLRPLL